MLKQERTIPREHCPITQRTIGTSFVIVAIFIFAIVPGFLNSSEARFSSYGSSSFGKSAPPTSGFPGTGSVLDRILQKGTKPKVVLVQSLFIPTIINIHVSVTTTSALITFDTSIAATNTIRFQTSQDGKDFDWTRNVSTATRLGHSYNLTGLNPGQTYRYFIEASAENGTTADSGWRSFTTDEVESPPPPPSDTQAPTTSNVQALSISANRATITWTTNEPATAQVRYGETSAYGKTSAKVPSLGTNQSQTLTGLKSNTVYHYCVLSEDAAGNQNSCTDRTFTTLNIKGDVNGDGYGDLAWHHVNGQVAIWLMNSQGNLQSTTLPGTTASGWTLQGVGDVNGDGYADLAWHHDNGQVAIWLMNSLGNLQSTTLPGTTASGWTLQGLGDVNGDGYADLAWHHDNGQVAIWLMNSLGNLQSTPLPGTTASGWTLQGLGDVNGDGYADLAWHHDNGQVAIWLMNSQGNIQSTPLPGMTASGWTLQGVGDVNGDGYADLAWHHDNGQVAIWLMNSQGNIQSTPLPGMTVSGWTLQGVRDVNGDGYGDLAWHHDNGQVTIWLMNNQGNLQSTTLPGMTVNGWELLP